MTGQRQGRRTEPLISGDKHDGIVQTHMDYASKEERQRMEGFKNEH